MSRADLHMQGRRAGQPAQAQLLPECGRISQMPGLRHRGGMAGRDVAVALPKSLLHRYIEAIPLAKNHMQEALLHERAALCFLEVGELDESISQAKVAHFLFKEIHPDQARQFEDRFNRRLHSSLKGAVAVEFFDL